MASYLSNMVGRYWQDKATGQVIFTQQPRSYKPSREWHLYFREVRLFRDSVNEVVMAEDVAVANRYWDTPGVEEISLVDFNYWHLVYSNPDI